MRVIDTTKAIKFLEEFQPQPLYVSSSFKIPIICMEEGQTIPPHPGGAGIFYVVEGTAAFTIDGEVREAGEGSTVIAPHGVARGIKAKSRLVAIAFAMQ